MARAPEILPFGPNGLLIRFALQASPEANSAVRSFLDALHDVNIPGIVQKAGSLVSVYVEYVSTETTRDAVYSAVSELLATQDWLASEKPAPTRLWHIPVAFGGEMGPQLDETAELTGQSAEQAIKDLCEADVEVMTIGFSPGQPYVGLLPEHWNMPRQSEINPRVPAGALVAAVRQLVLFNEVSATGWRHIGQTAFRPFFNDRQTPILLKSGDAIKFHAVSASEMTTLLGNNPEGLGGARCEVLS